MLETAIPCPHCGYAIPPGTHSRCPECGRTTNTLAFPAIQAEVAGWTVRIVGFGMLASVGELEKIGAACTLGGLLLVSLTKIATPWVRRGAILIVAYLAGSMALQHFGGEPDNSPLAFLNSWRFLPDQASSFANPILVAAILYGLCRDGLVEERLNLRRRLLMICITLGAFQIVLAAVERWCEVSTGSPFGGTTSPTEEHRQVLFFAGSRWSNYFRTLMLPAQQALAGMTLLVLAPRIPR